MGSTKGVDTLQSKLYSGFKAYENRSRLNGRLDIIEQEILKVSKYEVILSKREKESIANGYESIAQHSLKAIILIELQVLSRGKNK